MDYWSCLCPPGGWTLALNGVVVDSCMDGCPVLQDVSVLLQRQPPGVI